MKWHYVYDGNFPKSMFWRRYICTVFQIVLVVMVLISIPIVFGNVIITPNPQSMSIKQNADYSFEATVSNSHDFKVVDFTFDNLTGFTFPNGLELLPNESKSFTVGVNLADAGSFDLKTRVAYKYLVNLPDEPQTYFVNITQYGFSPDSLVVKQGDTITWVNTDQISRTVTSALFDNTLQPNQEFSYVLSDIGTFYYQDLVLFYGGQILIGNASEEQRVNNPSFDFDWNFHLDVSMDPTDLKINNNQQAYTVGVSDTVEGILDITNIGQIPAQKIHLLSDPPWVSFDENDFELAVGEKNFINYHVSPAVFETASTNRTYAVAIRVKGMNTDQTSFILNVNVPYSNVFDEITTNEGFLNYYSAFCKANPDLFICNPNANQTNTTTIIIRDPEVPVNLSTREVLAMLQRIQRIEDSNARTNNQLKDVSSRIDGEIPVIKELINTSVVLQQNNESVSTSRQRAFWVGMIFVIIIGSIITIALAIRHYHYRKNLMDGGYRFR